MDQENWVGLDEIAEYLDVKKETVRSWIKKMNMPAHKVGKLWKFRKSEIEDWIQSGKSIYKGEIDE